MGLFVWEFLPCGRRGGGGLLFPNANVRKNYHFCENQKCTLGPNMQFFLIIGFQKGAGVVCPYYSVSPYYVCLCCLCYGVSLCYSVIVTTCFCVCCVMVLAPVLVYTCVMAFPFGMVLLLQCVMVFAVLWF